MAEMNNDRDTSCTMSEKYMPASCGCIGYGYVPVQELNCIYDIDAAISNGTVFPELDLDMCEYGCICKCGGGVSGE